MLNDLLMSLGLTLSPHVIAVAVVLLVLSVIHLLIVLALRWRMRQHRVFLNALRNSATGVRAGDQPLRDFDWCERVRRQSLGPRPSDSATVRKLALDELDSQLEGNGWQALLHHLAPVGPLMGVLLTTFGLLKLEVPTTATGIPELLETLFRSIQPISLSMAAGVLVALFNLSCQHIGERGSERVRRAARLWIDQIVLPELQAEQAKIDVSNPVAKAIVQISAMHKQFEIMAATFGNSVQSLADVASRLKELPQRFDAMTKAATRLADASETLTGDGRSTVGRLDNLAGALEDSLTGRLGSAAKSLDRCSQRLDETSETLQQQAKGVASATQAVVDGSRAQAVLFAEVHTVLSERLLPTQHRMDESLNELNGSMAGLAIPVGQLQQRVVDAVSALSGVVGSINQLDLDFTNSVSEFRNTVENTLSPACRQQAAQLQDSATAIIGMTDAVKAIHDGVDSVHQLAGEQMQRQRSLNQATETISRGMQLVSDVNESLQSAITDQLLPTWSTLSQGVDDLRSSSRELNDTAVSLKPAVQSVGQLTRIVNDFGKVVDQLLPLDDTGRLIDALERVVAVIRELPNDRRIRR